MNVDGPEKVSPSVIEKSKEITAFVLETMNLMVATPLRFYVQL